MIKANLATSAMARQSVLNEIDRLKASFLHELEEKAVSALDAFLTGIKLLAQL